MLLRRLRNAIIGSFLLVIALAQCGSPATPAPNRSTFTPKPATKVASQPTVTASLTPTIPASPVPTTAAMEMADMKMDANTSKTGDPVKGKILFEKGNGNSAVPTCITCHNADSEVVKVGPSLVDIAGHGSSHAAEHGQDAETFLRESIIEPNHQIMEDPNHAYAVNGVSLMYQNYGKDLTLEEINDLLAYLMTLKLPDEHGTEHTDENNHNDKDTHND
jgi:cytochrome c2